MTQLMEQIKAPDIFINNKPVHVFLLKCAGIILVGNAITIIVNETGLNGEFVFNAINQTLKTDRAFLMETNQPFAELLKENLSPHMIEVEIIDKAN